MLRLQLARLRRECGQVALETLVVLTCWLLATFFVMNLFIYFGSAMLVQAQVNRLALQAGADGCLVQPSAASLTDEVSGMGVKVLSVQAASPNSVSASVLDQSQGARSIEQPSDVFSSTRDRHGNPYLQPGLQNAICPPKRFDTVPAGHYITVVVRYQQTLWWASLFGHPTVERSATALSQNQTEALR